MIIRNPGLIEFHEALSLQDRLASAVAGGAEETLLLLEHPPVYTMGSGGSEENILDPSVRAVRVNRGGDVTYHGPGQLVGYPIMNLSRRGRDLHRYLRFLEDLLMETLADFGVSCIRVEGRTGVWCGRLPHPAKIASIGIGVRRWVTMHGFALNVNLDTAPFDLINPCGMEQCRITSLSRETGREVSVQEVVEVIGERFEMLADELLPATFSDIII
jgi:lipoyl(octanoyl) transferase